VKRRSVMIGLARLGRFRADGLEHFEGTPQAFLNSLAPLLGFALVGAVMMAARGDGRGALTDLLSTAIVLIAPGVISEPLVRHWDRDAEWTKFAVAFNWCQWTVPVVFFLCLILSGVLVAAGWREDGAVLIAVMGVVGYGLSLHWFLARKALGLSRGRTALLVAAMNIGTGLLAVGPRLAAGGASAAWVTG
jgi:hypothetical protein